MSSPEALLIKQTIKLLVDLSKYIENQPVIIDKHYPQRNKEKFELLNRVNILLRKIQEKQNNKQ